MYSSILLPGHKRHGKITGKSIETIISAKKLQTKIELNLISERLQCNAGRIHCSWIWTIYTDLWTCEGDHDFKGKAFSPGSVSSDLLPLMSSWERRFFSTTIISSYACILLVNDFAPWIRCVIFLSITGFPTRTNTYVFKAAMTDAEYTEIFY